jgi:hypothetical protein
MNSIQFIANQMKRFENNLDRKIQDVNTICAFTGLPITKGILKKDFISSTFTDFEYLKYQSDYVGLDIALCMDYIIPNENNKLISLRFKSFYVSEYEIRFLKREDLESLVFNIQNRPFILCISFGFKKHISFKSQVQLSDKSFTLFTDKGSCKIDIESIQELYKIIQKWYTVIESKKNTSQQPTSFTKDDIIHGCRNYTKISEYQGDYFKENDIIEKYRGTFLIELLAHILNKTI